MFQNFFGTKDADVLTEQSFIQASGTVKKQDWMQLAVARRYTLDKTAERLRRFILKTIDQCFYHFTKVNF